jgi:tetratricopeptide (TPR) repeat protein
MKRLRKIWFAFLLYLCPSIIILAQHPNRQKIDSLKKSLPALTGVQRVRCLNALAEEHWWVLHQYPDSVACWAIEAKKEAASLHDCPDMAMAMMNLGVSEIYRRNFSLAESILKNALTLFETAPVAHGVAWCNLWISQTMFCENKYPEAFHYFAIAEPILEKEGDWEGLGKAWAWVSFGYAAQGDYDSSLYYCNKSLEIREKMNDQVCVAASFTNMGHLYRMVGDKEDALDFFRQGITYANTHNINYQNAYWNYMQEAMAIIYRLLNQLDSSGFYMQSALHIDPMNQMTRITLGENYLAEKKYDSALNIFLSPIDKLTKNNSKWDLLRVLNDVSKAYSGKNENHLAIEFARKSLSISGEANLRPYMLENYLLLSKLFEKTGKKDSAYAYLQKYTSLKDSVAKNQFMFRLSRYKLNEEMNKQRELVASLDKDNKLKEAKLEQETRLKKTLATGLLLAILAGIFLYRHLNLKRKNDRLENEKSNSELKLKAAELEMQALRAQMNPHFIFNCLSSINRFILKSETEAASDYLTKFSRLIRIVLTNSKNKKITLEDELEMLKLYLDMERLRFKNSFSYNISFTNSIETDNIYVPPLLLQPFAENAIWHGLMNKEGNGNLSINLNTEDDFLICTITDNGIGRKAATELKAWSTEKQKSMGLKITHERLALLNEFEQDKTFFEFEDLYDEMGKAAGTKVILRIRINEPIASRT